MRPYREISRHRMFRSLREPKWRDEAPINGYDTETISGEPVIVSWAFAGEEPGVRIGEDLGPLPPDRILSILTHGKARSPAVNIWYNLKFDATAILGYILSDEELKDIQYTNETTAEFGGQTYEFMSIRGKFLRIEDSNSHVYWHYDAAQFFMKSLDNAAAEWLGETKEEADVTNLKDVPRADLSKYAKTDARLVRDLWELFSDLAENELDYPVGRPISTGHIAEHVMRDRLQRKPAVGPTWFQSGMTRAYLGGRFETFRRGSFEEVVGLDINSAYPYHMTRIPDLSTCDVRRFKDKAPAEWQLREADRGFVTATVTTDIDRAIQPFGLRERVVRFPALQRYKVTVTREEFLFALDNDYLINYEIEEAGLVYAGKHADFPFEYLKEEYGKRLQYKDRIEESGDRWDKLQYIIKVILNSHYGKTAQVTEKQDYGDPEEPVSEPYHELKPYLNLEGDPVVATHEAGEFFNPYFATNITAFTRLQLHRMALQLDVESDVIQLATDCLMVESDTISAGALEAIIAPRELGAWDFDYKGSAFVLGSGVYDVKTDSGFKIGARGFKEAASPRWEFGSWREAARAAKDAITITSNRPTSIAEYLRDGTRKPAEFFEPERELRPDFDKKREWSESATFDRLLSGSHGSRPIVRRPESGGQSAAD